VDVAIVGAGITGLVTAHLLKKAGKTVAVIDKSGICGGETGHTTAHLTEVIDSRYHALVKDFGATGAKQAAQASRAAIDWIERTVTEHSIDCGFSSVPAFLYAEREDEVRDLMREIEFAREAGLDASFVNPASMPLPFATSGAMRVGRQAQFHPVRFLLALATRIQGGGSHVLENSPVSDFKHGEPCWLQAGGTEVTARDVVFATNHPIATRLLLHTKLAAYRTYAVASPLAAGQDSLPDGLYWDMQDPYHYTRTQVIDGNRFLIVGGEDHKTGHEEDTDARFSRLMAYATEKFGVTRFDYRWSGQIIEPVDGLPFIGRSPGGTEHFLVATGYGGNGMTFGPIAGMILSDALLGVTNPWASLFEARRIKPMAAALTYVMENVDFPRCLLRDQLAPAEAKSLAEVPAGEGRIVSVSGHKVAVYRDERGECHGVSSVCTHLGCQVGFNSAEKSWDCPCHGSRFGTDGRVINGPAVSALKRIELGAGALPGEAGNEGPRRELDTGGGAEKRSA
jgi:glycine/D-amino acid oxidase-like deaminating enzyme/nitrite reductase/ring-hydroxylating ferredoxin subunit